MKNLAEASENFSTRLEEQAHTLKDELRQKEKENKLLHELIEERKSENAEASEEKDI